MLTSRQEMPSALLNGRVYTPGGMNPQGDASAVMEVYDPASNAWSAAPSLPEGRHHPGTAVAGGRLYVIGGYLPGVGALNPSDSVFVFDPTAGVWSRKSPIPTPRAAHVSVTVAGKIYCIGGVQTGDVVVGTNQVYDPASDTWSTLAPMPTPREHLAAAVINGKIFVVGGRAGSSNNRQLESYDPVTGTWETLPPLPTGRSGLAAAELRNRLYVFGGEIPGVFAENEQYDPATRSWRTLAPMITPRHGMGAVTVGGSVFLIGGGKTAGLDATNANEVFTLP
jgi:N-acetylneuraminic acid mutarotase